jgi:microcin C transport system substrate-binding protein
MYPRFWDFGHCDNAYDVPFLEDGSINPDRKLKPQTNNLESMCLPQMDELVGRYRASSDKQEMIELAHTMYEMRHEYASFVPGFVRPAYRVGHWRWIRYPEGFHYKHSRDWLEHAVFWIDTDMKAETLEARKNGTTFEPQINVYDQHATP